MSEWKEVSLGNIATIVDCEHKTAPIVEKSEFYSVRTANISKGKIDFDSCNRVSEGTFEVWTKRTVPRIGDIILAREAPVGEVGWIDGRKKVCLGQRTVLIRINDNEVDAKYILYYLTTESSKFDLISQSVGSVVAHLNVKNIREFDMKIHESLCEQTAIASILTSLDDKIDLLHHQNQTLEKMAETLFRQWFVEEAKEEWEEVTISNLIEFNPRRSLVKNTIAPYLEMSNLSTTTYSPSFWYDRAFTSGTKFQNGDTLLASITPCLENGKTAYVDFLEDNQVAWGSTEYIVMRTKGHIHPFFAYVLARFQEFRDFAEGCMSGSSGRQRVDVQNLKSYQIKLPDELTISKWNVFAQSTVLKSKNNNEQIRTLTSMRDNLLPKLMSGEVRVEF